MVDKLKAYKGANMMKNILSVIMGRKKRDKIKTYLGEKREYKYSDVFLRSTKEIDVKEYFKDLKGLMNRGAPDASVRHSLRSRRGFLKFDDFYQ